MLWGQVGFWKLLQKLALEHYQMTFHLEKMEGPCLLGWDELHGRKRMREALSQVLSCPCRVAVWSGRAPRPF